MGDKCIRCEEHDGAFRHGVSKRLAEHADGGLMFETNHVRCWVKPGENSDLYDSLNDGESYYVEIGIYRPTPVRRLTELYRDYMSDKTLTPSETERLEDAFKRLDELDAEPRG